MNDDEIKCLCEQLSKANREITTLKCKCFGLEKENEQLTKRVDLLENRPFPQHYDFRVSEPTGFEKCFNRLDMYTLEKIYCELESMIDNYPMKLKPVHWDKIIIYKGILAWLWDKMDEDSQEWLTKTKNNHYEGLD